MPKVKPPLGNSWLKASSSTCLDGEYSGSIKYYKVNYIENFGTKSKHSGKIKKIYFIDKDNKEVVLVKNPIPKSNDLTQFKTPGKKKNQYDKWSSCTHCALIEPPLDPRTIYKNYRI